MIKNIYVISRNDVPRCPPQKKMPRESQACPFIGLSPEILSSHPDTTPFQSTGAYLVYHSLDWTWWRKKKEKKVKKKLKKCLLDIKILCICKESNTNQDPSQQTVLLTTDFERTHVLWWFLFFCPKWKRPGKNHANRKEDSIKRMKKVAPTRSTNPPPI